MQKARQSARHKWLCFCGAASTRYAAGDLPELAHEVCLMALKACTGQQRAVKLVVHASSGKGTVREAGADFLWGSLRPERIQRSAGAWGLCTADLLFCSQ